MAKVLPIPFEFSITGFLREHCRQMNAEENPPEKIESASEAVEADISSENGTEHNEPVTAQMAELADAWEGIEENDVAAGATGAAMNPRIQLPPPIAKSLDNLSAKGGAVGALVLGIWCIIGSFITNWSILNGILGLLLGIWGLTSAKKTTAWVGIICCLIGMSMSLLQVSDLISTYMNAIEEPQF